MDQDSIDLKFLSQCLELAKEAEKLDEVPVGALVVNSSTREVVAKAYNLKEKLQSPLGHAEVIAIHRACKKLGTWRLTGHTLYSSLEPCVMCSSVIVQSRLDRVVYSATDLKGGGQSLFELFDNSKLNHQPQWSEGLLEEDNRLLLKNFFKRKRQKPSS